MKTSPRIASIINAQTLEQSLTGFNTFELSELEIAENVSIAVPRNVRLGHLVEKIVAGLIRASRNYKLLYENTQLTEGKKTIGEIDFLIMEIQSGQITHVELAYKFYLYDPGNSEIELNNWIGPNRNDSLHQKLAKLKQKQFPLLFQPSALQRFEDINIQKVAQKLCFLVSLFVPYNIKIDLSSVYQHAILGYYVDFKTFAKLNTPNKHYYIPPKKEWGVNPISNKKWSDFESNVGAVKASLNEEQAILCWQKDGHKYEQFFVVWW